MRAMGLTNVRAQRFATRAWSRGRCDVTILEPRVGALDALAHGFSPTEASITARVLDAGYGYEDDYQRMGRRVRGKLVLVLDGAPEGRRGPHRTERLRWAAAAGASGMLLVSRVPGQQPQTGTCSRDEAPILSVGLSQEQGTLLQRLLGSGRSVRARVELRNTIRQARVANVLGDLPGGTKSGEVVVVGGHLDSWDISPGAVDNGSGCAVVLGIARSLLAVRRPARRTVRFALWAAEEIGLQGSRHYVRVSAAQLGSHVAYVNFDMPGDAERLLLCGRPAEAESLQPLARRLAGLGLSESVATGVCMATDLRPFLLAGVPVLSVLGSLTGAAGACYHTASDTPEKLPLAGLLRTTACGAALTLALADQPELPFGRHSAAEVNAIIDLEGLRDSLEDVDLMLAPG
jgi:hypothetical protein